MFPFDTVVLVENAELSALYKIQLSEFQAHVLVHSGEPNDWTLRDVKIERNDGVWVNEPIFHQVCWDAACSATGIQAIDLWIEGEIATRRANAIDEAAEYRAEMRRDDALWFRHAAE